MTGLRAVSTDGNPSRRHAALARLVQHGVGFPLLMLALLMAVWAVTWQLTRLQYRQADEASALLAVELANTYEAQAVRALREIDQTLRLVAFTHAGRGAQAVQVLMARDLLPSTLLFEVSVFDARGKLVASSRAPATTDISADADFGQLRSGARNLQVSPPIAAGAGEWRLRFSRHLDAAVEGGFAGVAAVTVDAAYFVSDYDGGRLGAHGVLALLGTDGVFRALRSGDTVTAGGHTDIPTLAPEGSDAPVPPTVSPWDGVHRHLAARRLFAFPVVVVAGVSTEEALAPVREEAHHQALWAAAASAAMLVILAVLWRASHQVAAARQLEAQARIAHAEQVEHLAYHDGLTGLPNRSLFSKLLDQHVATARRYGRKLAVLFLDLDRFKQINDTLGHDAGDDLLKEVARRLTGCLRDSDIVARLGGDEFVVLLPELQDERPLARVATKMLEAVAGPFVLAGQQYRITVSIGIAVYPDDGIDETTLKKHADIAMYHAKELGKNNYQFFSPDLQAQSLDRMVLEAGLRQAVAHDELLLHYQPRRDAEGRRITGMEALLRWNHPELGLVAPMRFIPVAEETGLIVPIGRWVLKAACAQHMAWQRQGLTGGPMAVNVSLQQLHDDQLVSDVQAALDQSGMPPEMLELEVSEATLMRDVEHSMKKLRALKALGVRMAIDDFGVGYSSLATFEGFPIDTVKIDRSLIRGVTSVDENRRLTHAIIEMGRSLSMMVVAQGVENREQVEVLRSEACDEFQGFYFNQPLAAEDCAELLRKQAA